MTKADRVHSTPPTNTSAINTVDPTRRGFITLAAGASIISVGSLAAVAMPIAAAIPNTEAATTDPAFALIAEKLAADVAHCAAIDAQDEAESDEERDPDAVEEAFQRCCVACTVVNEADWRLATTPPTTLAGVAAVLRFANEIEDGGMEWPATDTIGCEGWHYQLRATMAAAIEALIKGWPGRRCSREQRFQIPFQRFPRAGSQTPSRCSDHAAV